MSISTSEYTMINITKITNMRKQVQGVGHTIKYIHWIERKCIGMAAGKDGWLASAATLTVTGAGMWFGAPYIAIGGAIATGICIYGAKKEEAEYKKKMKFFEAVGLYTEFKEGEKVYPSLIKEGEGYIVIALPSCMEFKLVKACKESIERYFGRNILLEETSNKKIVIKILEPTLFEQDRWTNIFNELDIIDLVGDYPRLIDSEMNRIGHRLVFSLPPNFTLDSFKKKQTELEYRLKCKVLLSVDRYKLIIQTVANELKDFYTTDFRKNILPDMKFLLGLGFGEEPVILDLSGNEFSTLVAGASGTGKSAFLNCLMVQMILKDVIIHAIDLKAVEFSIFRSYSKMNFYANNRKDATKVLADTYDLMLERYKELEANGCKNYADYNEKFKNAMPPVLLIIDEFSALTNGGDKNKANMFLFELMSRARASNICVVICTQLPKAKVLDTSIRCNIKNTVCFSVESDTDSEVALGQKGNFRAARELKTAGRGFLKSKKELIEFQGYFLTDEQIEEQIKHKMSVIKPVATSAPVAGIANEKVIPIPKKVSKKDKKINVNDVVSKIENL